LKQTNPNSRVYTKELLNAVERNYKKSLLDTYGDDVFVLQYDANEPINFDDIVADLENLDFDDPKKCSTWQIRREQMMNDYRSM
jgi:hypothetical protein